MSTPESTHTEPERAGAESLANQSTPDPDQEAQLEDRTRATDDDTVRLKVFRYDPEVEGKQEPRFDDFLIPYERGMTVLDALIYARDEFDSSLTFRHSCRMAVCGSDGFFINGR